MVKTDPVEVPIEVDDKAARVKFDELEKRIKKFEETGKKSGKSSGAFMAAAVGGAAGFVAGSIMQNQATNTVMDLILTIIAAALLPVFEAMMPVLEKLLPVLEEIGRFLGMSIEGIGDTAENVGKALQGDPDPFLNENLAPLLNPQHPANLEAQRQWDMEHGGPQGFGPKQNINDVSFPVQDFGENLGNFFTGNGWRTDRDIPGTDAYNNLQAARNRDNTFGPELES